MLIILASILSLAFKVSKVAADGSIYIRADGLVEGTDKIVSIDNITYAFTDNVYASVVVEKSNIVIDGNGFTLNGSGLIAASGFSLTSISNVTIKNVNIRDFSSAAIFSSQASLNTISENNITNNYAGIWLDSSDDNTILGNRIATNSWYGIYLNSSSQGYVLGNILEENGWHAIVIDSSSDNTINGNDVARNARRGIYLQSSSNNTISDNNVGTNGWCGIRLISSPENLVVGNSLKTYVDGIGIEYSDRNTINGNNLTGKMVAGFEGIWLSSSVNNTVSGNIIGNYAYGIATYSCLDNNAIGNLLSNNIHGVFANFSSTNISENLITSNNVGLLLENSSDSLLYHNNIISNTVQANVTSGFTNVWDNGYPSGGNFWGDYVGTDQYSGPDQNITGSDFIGDTYYNIDLDNADRYPLMLPRETESPLVAVLSPENKTYVLAVGIVLDYIVSEPVSWVGYSLDGQTNVTINGNTTLPELSDGNHSVVVHASDISGNQGMSDVVYFSVKALPPSIQIVSPENKTYPVTSVPLAFTVNETVTWMGYSLDGQANVTIVENATLTGLSEGSHYVAVYANDTVGNMGLSDIVHFSVDTTPPSLEIVLPLNITYYSNSIPLTFLTDEATTWMGYSLDGQLNVTIDGNTTVNVEYGFHYLVISASDSFGNTGSSGIVNFTVTIPGDINTDGTVDIFDIVIIAGQFGKPPPPIEDLRADVNGDEIVDIFDLTVVALHFGETL